MDVEAMQLLNLSPIPELSEMEISTMLEQLDGLSDLNSDLTDRNVEDILKEAEELIDKSSPRKFDKSKTISNNTNSVGDVVTAKISCVTMSRGIETAEDKGKSNVKQAENNAGECSSPRNTDDIGAPHNSSVSTVESIKTDKSEVKQNFHSLFSQGNSVNHIKLTIDSLKEYSSLIEKQISRSQTSPVSNSTSKSNKMEVKKKVPKHNKESVILSDSKIDKSKSSLKSTIKPTELLQKENSCEIHSDFNKDKPNKVQNCFERLYQERPVRLLKNLKKPKQSEKIPKVLVKKKNSINLKACRNPSESRERKLIKSFPVKNISANEMSGEVRKRSEKLNENESLIKTSPPDKTDLEKFVNGSDGIYSKVAERTNLDSSKDDFHFCPTFNSVQPKMEERLMLLLLQEMKEIKDQIKRTGINSRGDLIELGRLIMEGEKEFDGGGEFQTETEKFPIEKIAGDTMPKNSGIERLEEQLSALKTKYEEQIEKLERENENLKEELKNGKKLGKWEPEEMVETELGKKIGIVRSDVGLQTEPEKVENLISKVSSTSREDAKSNRIVSPEVSPVPDEPPKNPSMDAFSQTESAVENVAVQCAADSWEKVGEDDGGVEGGERKKNSIEMGSRVENKENLASRKKNPLKSKPLDSNFHPAMAKQKKMSSEHEIQLMAALRGLKLESAAKEKENRKLKSEMDLLKSQLRKLSIKKKNEESKGLLPRPPPPSPSPLHHHLHHHHQQQQVNSNDVGSQTIALGPITQRPYDPEIYEASNHFERENEELKLRIKALEETFELLKEKRINDLQSLHQVHEKEMAKLVSKLETQSNLTKHLHSLLTNR